MKSRSPLISLLFALSIFFGMYALAPAQQNGPEPGEADPVGPPAAYITLRSDDLMIGKFQSGGLNVLDTYQVDSQSNLSTPIASASGGTGVFGQCNSVSASGHILVQDNDQVINAGRSADGRSVEVRFPLAGSAARVELPNLHSPILNTPDQIAVAVGDMDKIADEDGENHDEVVVAYATGPGPRYPVNLAVLNYSSGQGSEQPLYTTTRPLTQVVVSPLFSGAESSSIDELLSVAIGDFDGDGQNEIAVATVTAVGFTITLLRYVHNLDTDTPSLVQVSNTAFPSGPGLLPTISLAAGNFTGSANDQSQLLLALRYDLNNGLNLIQRILLQTISINSSLKPTLKGSTAFQSNTLLPGQGLLTTGRVKAVAGLFRYDPGNGFDLYRRQVAVAYNDREPVNDDSGAGLGLALYQVSSDLNSITGLGGTSMPAAGVGAKFDLTAGGLAVDQNINTPLWSLAVEQLQSQKGGAVQGIVTTARLAPDFGVASSNSFAQSCPNGTGAVFTDNGMRPTLQAYDYRGRTALLGAPIRLTADNVIGTDFVLEEPPKHAYWDETTKLLNIISRVPSISTSLTNTSGVSFSAKSTDSSANSVGATLAATASQTVEKGADFGAKELGIRRTKTTEANAKVVYNYEQNKDSYNSKYASRTLTETQSTDNDDVITGRAQVLDIWRYRALGVTGEDEDGNPQENLFYDCVLPGPQVNFKASGLDLDWYQPLHENGNILSYPSPTENTFNPPDLGTYEIPCPPGASDCNDDGTLTQSGAMIPATSQFISGTSGTIGLDYSNDTGSGNSFSYKHKINPSADLKRSYNVHVKLPRRDNKRAGSVSLALSSENSFGNTETSDSTTTSSTGIKISRSAISSALGYEFFPTIYATLDGTIKVAHAVDPLGSAAGASFWAKLYGAKADPALNLPLRFVRNTVGGLGTHWIPSTLISRKKMRGFFLMSSSPDPVTGEHVILAQAPVDGQQVRLSAQVYNYSIAKSFSDCIVRFYAIKYDSLSDTEIGQRKLIGSTTITLPPRGTAPAQIVWDTTGFGPSGDIGGQDYRIYVDLNSDNLIDETYSAEDPTKLYGPGLPVGVDPGQNDEGWGLATVMAPVAEQDSSYSQPAALYFGAKPLAISRMGRLSAQNLTAREGISIELRARICARSNSLDPVDVVVFDGDPADGNVVAWKTIFVPNKDKCEGTWFNWTPTRGRHRLVATILPNTPPPILPNNARLISKVRRLVRTSLQIDVP